MRDKFITRNDLDLALANRSGGTIYATNVEYNNGTSWLTSTNVQDAIDELGGSVVTVANSVESATEYKIGDTYSNTAYDRPSYAGYITTSNTVVYITVVLDKRMSDDISLITVNSLNGLFRGVGGYIDGITSSTELTTRYTVAATKSAPNMVRISLTKTTAMTGATNNTSLICMARMSLTFS